MKGVKLCVFYEWPVMVECLSSENLEPDVPESWASITFRETLIKSTVRPEPVEGCF
jgi:hypothetical protein